MRNSISITRQNLTLASAQRAAIDNREGLFQIVAFRVDTEDAIRDELPTSTGFNIIFDPRLKVLGDDEEFWFLQKVYTADGRKLGSKAHGGDNQSKFNDNQFFVATADGNSNFTDDGFYLYYACVQFPDDVAVGDEFDITILTTGTVTNYEGDTYPVEFLCVNEDMRNLDQEAQSQWTAEHIQQGKFTIVE